MAGWTPTRPLNLDLIFSHQPWAGMVRSDAENLKAVTAVELEYPVGDAMSDNIAVAEELTFPYERECPDEGEWRFRADEELQDLYAAAVQGWGLSPVTALLRLADYWLSWPPVVQGRRKCPGLASHQAGAEVQR